MTREAKLGLFGLIVLAASIWGYKYLKGQNLLSDSYNFKSTYEDVTGLTISSPVLINGLPVGSVTNIDINRDNLKEMIVSYSIEKDYKIPKNAVTYQISNGLVSGKALSIKYNKVCSGGDCAKSGEFLKGDNMGLIGSMMDESEVDEYVSKISTEVNTLISDLGSPESKGAINETLRGLNASMANIEQLTKTSDALMKRSYSSLAKTVENMASITENLVQNNAQITSMLSNLNTITSDIKDANIGATVNSANSTLTETTKAVEQLQTTLADTDKMIKDLNNVILKMDSGDGTLSKLLNDEQLYTNLEKTSSNLSLLLQDLRLNPKRYVNVSVFGKKQKEYVVPEDDPAEKKN